MEPYYSSPPHIRSNLTVASESRERVQDLSDTGEKDERGTTSQRNPFMTHISACWCLIAHCTLSVGVAVLVLFGIEGHHFNVTERTPIVQIVGGTRVAQFFPMQSDIVTFLSSTIAILKVALSAWVSSLCWNIALFLMEGRGLTRQNLRILIKNGLLAPGACSRDLSIVVIGALLLATLVANLSSPILTGSISWVPSSRLVHDLSVDPVNISITETGALTKLPSSYYNNPQTRQRFVISSLGSVANAWGTRTDKGILKRFITVFNTLQVNSTIENLMLPYFEVHSIRWIKKRDEIPGIRDGVNPDDVLGPHFVNAPGFVTSYPTGYAILIPNVTTNWSSDPLDSTIIQDTRLLALNYGYDEPTRMWTLSKDLPSDTYLLPHSQAYLAFAWVTFRAGVGRCKAYTCVISSPGIIRNNTPLELEPHLLTFQALSMALNVGVHLASANMSLPNAWDNLNDYVEAVLLRSYSGAWTIMNSNFVRSMTVTSYVPSIPSLVAQVDSRRIYTWLGIQLAVTTLSVLFLVARSRLSEYPLIGDTSLTAFDLDTTAILVEDASQPVNRAQKIEPRGDRLTVQDEYN